MQSNVSYMNLLELSLQYYCFEGHTKKKRFLGVYTKHVYVVVQFYLWFKFSFLLFLGMVMYDNNMIMSLKQKKRKFEPRIKLNHNIYTCILTNT